MDTRRFRKNRSSEMVDRARWLGWVMLMMFVLTQVASGVGPSVANLRPHASNRARVSVESDGRLLPMGRVKSTGAASNAG
jgi:hypothetical protein